MRHHRLGFSIIELMVVLTVAGIILALGVPSFNRQIKNSRLTTGVNELVAAMHLSRSESSKRRAPVVMCTSTTALDVDNESCDPAADWNDGWIVFADILPNGNFDNVDVIVQRQGPQTDGLRVIANEQIERTITYLPTGFAQLPLNTISGRFIVYCDDSNDDRFSRVLSFSNSGRPNIVPHDTNANGVPSCAVQD